MAHAPLRQEAAVPGRRDVADLRAYLRAPSLSNSRGLPTNAIYGFTMMLRKLITSERPDYLGVAFDGPERTFRHDAYEGYKATRTKMPDDLTLQLPYIQRLCQALRVPVIREAGYEADDIIGTLAAQAERAGLDVVIVTNDKDMNQLVTDRVKILRTERTGEMKTLDAKSVEEKMGVPPSQVVELLDCGRHYRQHSGRARHRREGSEANHPAIQHDRKRDRARGRDFAKDLSREPQETT